MSKNKERLNVIKCKSGGYSGHLVNLPVVAEGDTIEELKENAKITAKHWVKLLSEILEKDEPFEVKEFSNIEEYLNS